MTNRDVTEVVRNKYSAVAQSGLSSEHDGVRAVARAFGYSPDELASIPAEANMGLSCGNPTAFASLRAGETVVDLGSGGGLDVFLAARKVGPTGKAIGIDMTREMIDLARKNAAGAKGADGKPLTNVEFHHARIDQMPLADASADVVISNCVINLAPDKPAVFREMHRVLKPGGRIAISDIALKQPLPDELANDLNAYVGCIAGAILLSDYRAGLLAAGFADLIIQQTGSDLNVYGKAGSSGCCTPAMESKTLPIATECCSCGDDSSKTPDTSFHARFSDVLRKYNINDYAASVRIYAIKR